MCSCGSSHQPGFPGSYLIPFTEGPRAWLVLVRNAIPIIGVYGFGWSSHLVILQIWFDGITALGAMLAFQVKAFAKHDEKISDLTNDMSPNSLPFMVTLLWLAFWLLFGIPYWFTLLFFGPTILSDGSQMLQTGDVGIIAALIMTVGSNLIEQSRRCYEQMSDANIHLEFNWNFNIHLARIAAMLLVTFFFQFALVIPLALTLSFIEIYPVQAMRILDINHIKEAKSKNQNND